MLRNYLKIAFRTLRRNRLTTLLNVAGLSVGVAACLVVYLIVQFEFNFDQDVPDAERVYRIVSGSSFTEFTKEEMEHTPGLPAPVPGAAREEVPGAEIIAAFHKGGFRMVEVPRSGAEPAQFRTPADDDEWLAYADGSFFDLLPRTWLVGSPKASISKPGQIVLTERQARLYFGEASPAIVGRRLIGMQHRDTLSLTVSGLVQDLDAPSDFDFKAFVSLSTLTTSKKHRDDLGFEQWEQWNGTSSLSQCLVKIAPGTDPNRYGEQVTAMVERHLPAGEERGKSWQRLQPLADIHFNADYAGGNPVTDRPTLLVLSLAGGFLLLLACINFINLATAQSTQRTKEIGVRKTLGSARRQLVFQFLAETLLLTLTAVVLALGLAQGALLYLGDIVPKGVSLDFSRPHLYGFLMSVALVTALLAGLYPGVLVSRLSPVAALRNQTGGAAGSTGLRRVLIVGQFVVAQVFIIGALLVGQQIKFLLNTELGFQREAIVTFRIPTHVFFSGDRHDTRFTLADRIRDLAGIERVSLSSRTPVARGSASWGMNFSGKKSKLEFDMYWKASDPEYLPLYSLKLVAGRNLLENEEPQELVVNETLARQIGFQRPADAVGQFLESGDRKIPIVGVVRDFHHRSLHSAIQSMALMTRKSELFTFNVRFRPSGAETFDQTLAQIKTLWETTYPGEPFEAKFFDESVAELYGKERNLGKLFSLATGIAVFISCLGLFGLVTFTAERRTKEIGIRKVMGASVVSIVALLSADFLKLVVLAFFIASPLAWWGVSRWLENFAYKISIDWWIFVLAGGLSEGIALLTVSVQSVKAALMNPVKSLRAE